MSDTPHISSEQQALLKKIEQLELEKQQLISLVSHDLRSPLNRAFALSELLLMDKDILTDFQKDYLERMRLVIADGLAMMRNLVDYRNLEFRSIDTMPELINLKDFTNKIIVEFSAMAAKKHIHVTAELEEGISIKSDKQCLDRSISNLISNALKFSKPESNVWIRAASSGEFIKIEVQDEIGGFSEQEHSSLFQKFRKFAAQPTGNESSTGLGLYIAKSMAVKIGGEISCKTIMGTGSTFTITLPKTIN